MQNAEEQEWKADELQWSLEKLGGQVEAQCYEAHGTYTEHEWEVRKQLARTYKSQARLYFNPEVDDWDE